MLNLQLTDQGSSDGSWHYRHEWSDL